MYNNIRLTLKYKKLINFCNWLDVDENYKETTEKSSVCHLQKI